MLAVELGLDPAEATLIGHAARLHDIGKIGIADALLLKPGKYTAEEMKAMEQHASIGARILSGSTNELLTMAEQIALTHHERWDGRGYPNGISGEEIPLEGRIVAVADVFDALTHRRPYKEAWPVATAVNEVLGEAGTRFDPVVTAAFERLDHRLLVHQPATAPTAVPDAPPARTPAVDTDAAAA
jgi:putative two-component system response regulator